MQTSCPNCTHMCTYIIIDCAKHSTYTLALSLGFRLKLRGAATAAAALARQHASCINHHHHHTNTFQTCTCAIALTQVQQCSDSSGTQAAWHGSTPATSTPTIANTSSLYAFYANFRRWCLTQPHHPSPASQLRSGQQTPTRTVAVAEHSH